MLRHTDIIYKAHCQIYTKKEENYAYYRYCYSYISANSWTILVNLA